MLRRAFTTAATTGTVAPAAAAKPNAVSVPENFFGSVFQVRNHPKARYVINTKLHSAVPVFARDNLVPWARQSREMPDLSPITGTPALYLSKKIAIRKNARHSMQSGSDNEHYWKIVFPRTGNWVNQLMGYMSAGDCLQATGARLMRFDSPESALAFVKKMGWKAEIQRPISKLNVLGKKAYDNNFLNQHIKRVIQVRPPPLTMKTQFGHPDAGKSTWANLGQMAVKMGTSVHHIDKKVTGCSQEFWNSEKFDSSLGAKGWRYENDFRRVDELSKKLGK